MTETPERQPDEQRADTDDYATAEALTVTRDGEGNLLAKEAPTEMFGLVKAIPMTYGDVEAYFGDGDIAQIDSEVIARLLDTFIAEPNLADAAGGEVTGQWVRNELKPLAPRDLILAILSVSDIDADVAMDGAGSAEVEFEGN